MINGRLSLPACSPRGFHDLVSFQVGTDFPVFRKPKNHSPRAILTGRVRAYAPVRAKGLNSTTSSCARYNGNFDVIKIIFEDMTRVMKYVEHVGKLN